MQFGGNAETSIGAGGFFGAVRLLLRVLCDAVNPSDDLFYRWFASSSASASSPPKLPAFVQNPCSGCVSVCVCVCVHRSLDENAAAQRASENREGSRTVPYDPDSMLRWVPSSCRPTAVVFRCCCCYSSLLVLPLMPRVTLLCYIETHTHSHTQNYASFGY